MINNAISHAALFNPNPDPWSTLGWKKRREGGGNLQGWGTRTTTQTTNKNEKSPCDWPASSHHCMTRQKTLDLSLSLSFSFWFTFETNNYQGVQSLLELSRNRVFPLDLSNYLCIYYSTDTQQLQGFGCCCCACCSLRNYRGRRTERNKLYVANAKTNANNSLFPRRRKNVTKLTNKWFRNRH